MENIDELDMAIGRYFAFALVGRMLEAGLYDALSRGAPKKELAATCNMEPHIFDAALHYTVRYSGLIQLDSYGQVALSDFLKSSDTARFRMLKFLGAYNACVTRPGVSNTETGLLALAYRQLARRAPSQLVSLLAELRPRNVLEIGCGSAPVLRALAVQDTSVSGLAVDNDVNMVALARELVLEQRLSDRITVSVASLLQLAKCPPTAHAPFDTVVLRSVLNGSFAEGTEPVRLLSAIASTYQEAQIVISEYLSQLGTSAGAANGSVQTLSHDLIQVFSGQGLPPANLKDWDAIYSAAGVRRLARRVDRSLAGITQFTDIVVAQPVEVNA
ncbi:methyltransferase domain-containing protein [Pseudoduganella sp. FT93W]|uniref:Methyltransferase domain-containing protein n=1 Tax=Duganella fentianensis TaxID=2692177 RepID=A0A845I234_9BURK|nr:class I SAM-dependent methyltransferase [Duganella fentianensis]MYN45771.1 methyltransferase domain-containing protein [Duganella fentianensis]